MAKKEKIVEPDSYILPAPNEEMKEFVIKFKVDMMQNIIQKIKFAVENKLHMIEVFTFSNSPFVITIAEKEFDANLEHIEKYYTEKEIYELLPTVQELRKLLKK